MRLMIIPFLLMFSAASTAQTVVKKGDPAPFEGVILTKEEVAKMLAEKKALEKKLEAAVKFQKEESELKCKLKLDNKQLSLDTQKEKYDAILSIKDSEIDRLYKQVEKQGGDFAPLYFAGGFIGGAGMSIAIMYAINPGMVDGR